MGETPELELLNGEELNILLQELSIQRSVAQAAGKKEEAEKLRQHLLAVSREQMKRLSQTLNVEANGAPASEQPNTAERNFFSASEAGVVDVVAEEENAAPPESADVSLQGLPLAGEVSVSGNILPGLPAGDSPSDFRQTLEVRPTSVNRDALPPVESKQPAPVAPPQPANPLPAPVILAPQPALQSPLAVNNPLPPPPAQLPAAMTADPHDDLFADLTQAGLWPSGRWFRNYGWLAVVALTMIIGVITLIAMTGKPKPSSQSMAKTADTAASADQTAAKAATNVAAAQPQPATLPAQPAPVVAQIVTPPVAQATPAVVAQTQIAVSPTEQKAVAVVSQNPAPVANAATSPASSTAQVLPKGVTPKDVDDCMQQILVTNSEARKYLDLRQRCIGSLAGL